MPDPFSNLTPPDVAFRDVASFKAWTATLPAFDEWTAGMDFPEDVPEVDATTHPEIDTRLSLPEDVAIARRPNRRTLIDFRADPDALKHLKRLPRRGESIHSVTGGAFALFDLVGATMERSGATIDELYLVTLGFSAKNVSALADYLDSRRVKRVTLVASYYFSSTSPKIYDQMIPMLRARGQRILSIRNHAKALLMRMSDGRRFVCESTANLRSCGNIEIFCFSQCPRLYRFHKKWVESLFSAKGGGDAKAEVAEA